MPIDYLWIFRTEAQWAQTPPLAKRLAYMELRGLTLLNLSGAHMYGSEDIEFASLDWQFPDNYDGLEYLRIEGFVVSRETIRRISNFPKLKRVSFSGSTVDPNDILLLKECTSLDVIVLYRVKINEEEKKLIQNTFAIPVKF